MKNQKNNVKSFKGLLEFDSEEERIKHNATLISFQFISEINKVLADRNLRKSDLAQEINTSNSYISQLFNGDKMMNMIMLAQIQEVLDIRFDIKAMAKELCISGDIEDDRDNWGETQINAFIDRFKHRNGTWRFIKNGFVPEYNYSGIKEYKLETVVTESLKLEKKSA